MARGLIDVVTELGTRGGAAVGRVSVPPDTGIEAQFKDVAKDFHVIGNEIGQMADKAAAKEGDLEGRFAGLDPEFRTRRDGTIRGEAFDRAGLDIAETRLKQELSTGIDGAATKHAGDPQKLAGAIDAVGSGILKNAPDELKPKLMLKIRGSRLAHMREAARQQVAQLTREQHAATADDVTATLKGLEQKAALAGLDPTADDLLRGELASIPGTMGRKGPNGKPLYTPDQIRDTMKKAEDIVVRARIWGTFDRLPSVERKAEFIRNFEADWREGKGVAKVFDFDKMQSVSRFLEGEMRREHTQASAARRALEHELKLLQSRYEAGYEVRQDEAAALAQKVGAAGTPEQKAAFVEAEDMLRAQQWFRRLPPAEMDAEIERRRADLVMGDPALKSRAMRHLAIFEKVQAAARSELHKDPLGWADRVGAFKTGVAQLDFSGEDTLAASLKTRVAQADALAEPGAYGRDVMRRDGHVLYLRPGDVARLGGIMAKGGEGSLRVAGLIAQAVPEQAEAIMAQLGRHAPAMAMVGHLVATAPAGRTPQIATDAANGFALAQTEKFQPRVKPEQAKQLAAEVAGAAASAMPETLAAAVAVASSAYEVRARQARHAGSSEFLPDLWKKTLAEVLGAESDGHATYGGIGRAGGWWSGRDVLVPRGVRADAMDEVIGALSDADFGTLGWPVDGRGRMLGLQDIKSGHLVSVGPGRYLIARNDPASGDPQYMAGDPRVSRTSPDGLYVLDLNPVLPRLKKLRPGLFLGGARRDEPQVVAP